MVDGNWTINESAPKEADGHGIFNNVVRPEDFAKDYLHAYRIKRRFREAVRTVISLRKRDAI